ncbi:unnamed protein product [Clonostachys solani]|uniref:High-affinity methionine permease n=1 Tax=Clonostachys solani TaxID=160281 RepID=A0A9N9ZFW1_9HYPO|nr:unnamed protein product [Clonostachys solani]
MESHKIQMDKDKADQGPEAIQSSDNHVLPEDTKLGDIDKSLQAGELTMEEDTAGGMGRHLGLFSTTLLILGRIIGTGIFSTPSSITKSTGSVGAALLIWVLGFAISMAGMFVWLEFGSMFPRSGGEKVYLEASYRYPKSLATVVYAVYTVSLGFTATGAISFASYMWVAGNKTSSEWQQRGVAAAAVAGTCLIHSFAPRFGVMFMNAISSLKVFTLLFLIVSGWAVMGGAISKEKIPDPFASFENAFEGSSRGGNAYATALFKVLFAFAGWQNAAYVLNEVKDPVRTLRIAGPIALTISGVLYLLANVSYYAAGTPAEISKSGVTVAAYFFETVFNDAAKRAFSVLIAFSALGNVMTVTYAHSRINQELAKEGVIPFPQFWASTWPFGAPSAGLLLHFIPSFIMIVGVPFGDAYNFIINIEGYARSILFLLVVTGLFWLRKTKPLAHRPIRVWLPVAVLFLVGQAFLLVAPFLAPDKGTSDTSIVYWAYPLVGISVIIVGVIYWVTWKQALPKLFNYQLKEEKQALKDGTVVTRFLKVAN